MFNILIFMMKHSFFHFLMNELFRSALKLWHSENRTSDSAKSEDERLLAIHTIKLLFIAKQSEEESFIFQVFLPFRNLV
jgi:hypothetical protein